MTQQHYRVTLEQAIAHYQAGDLTAKSLVHFYIKLLIEPNTQIKIGFTESEIIEVKQITDWKGALGQVLVYSAFYPQHHKRIHLFGSQTELEKLTDVEAACLSFNVNVSAEEVQE